MAMNKLIHDAIAEIAVQWHAYEQATTDDQRARIERRINHLEVTLKHRIQDRLNASPVDIPVEVK